MLRKYYMFELLKTKGSARRGQLSTRRGIIQTPFFMPIATKGAIKSISSEEIRQLAPEIILSNTYHLMLRPGEDELKALGGLHRFMDWDRPILTDSGGFQVFSLSKIRKITPDGVEFSSHIDGRKMKMSPEDSMRIQLNIGSDIMMVLDECVELPAKREYLAKSVEMTTKWAQRCFDYLNEQVSGLSQDARPLLFGIVQGGTEQDLRLKSLADLSAIDFGGLAIGGLAVGETEEEMYSVLDYLAPEMPTDKPRYLMGVGYPHQIVEAVKRGIDMFDCVIPTREARHGRLYFWNESWTGKLLENENSKDFYYTLNCSADKQSADLSPINANSKFELLRRYSKAYLRHLYVIDDPLAKRLATLNNLEFYLGLMGKLRGEIEI